MIRSVLVVEDDRVLRESLRLSLSSAGFDVDAAATAEAGLTAVRDRVPGLVLLDLGLPDLDGFTLCRRFREIMPRAVIVVLTARHDEIDVVAGLESGADDYLFKPFKTVELIARLRAHLRRSDPSDAAPEELRVGALRIDGRARRAALGGVELQLRNREFDLLARFAAHPGVAQRREQLVEHVWGECWEGSTKTLDVHVLALRRLLETAARAGGGRPPVITTLRAFGYRLDEAAGI